MTTGSDPQDLRREDAFLLCCCHAFRDGELDEEENRTLRALATQLGLAAEEAMQIARAAQEAGRSGQLAGGAPLDPEELFVELCEQAAGDGRVDSDEAQLLLAVARATQLTPERARKLYAEATTSWNAPGAEEASSTEEPVEAPEPPRVELPEVAPEGAAPVDPVPDPGGALVPAGDEVPEVSISELAPVFAGTPRPPTLEERLEAFWQAPVYYLKKLVQGSSYERRARKVVRSIRRILSSSPRGETLHSLEGRVGHILRGIYDAERQYDALVRYLDGRVQPVAGSEFSSGKPVQTTLRPLREKREALRERLEASLRGLRQIEDAVAMHVLGGDDATSGEGDLEETLDEIGTLLRVVE